MGQCLHYDCEHRNNFGYCPCTCCINPKYNFLYTTSTKNQTEEHIIKQPITKKRNKFMGVYIKNMEMPKCCSECPCTGTDDYSPNCCLLVPVTVQYYTEFKQAIKNNTRPKWCPLIEIPSIYAEWKINSDGYYPYCSNCKQEPQGREMTDFCPNCGADMRKKNDL